MVRGRMGSRFCREPFFFCLVLHDSIAFFERLKVVKDILYIPCTDIGSFLLRFIEDISFRRVNAYDEHGRKKSRDHR